MHALHHQLLGQVRVGGGLWLALRAGRLGVHQGGDGTLRAKVKVASARTAPAFLAVIASGTIAAKASETLEDQRVVVTIHSYRTIGKFGHTLGGGAQALAAKIKIAATRALETLVGVAARKMLAIAPESA